MRCVSARYGNVISLCIFNSLEYEKTVDYAERGNSCECLVLIMSYTYLGIIFCVVRFSGYLNNVVACVLCGKVKIAECGCACCAGINCVSVFIGNLDAVGSRTADSTPFDCLIAYGNDRSGKFFTAVLIPNCVKGGVCIEYGVLSICIGKFCTVLVYTYEPTAELVALSFGGRNAVKFTVYRSDRGNSVCTLVAEVEVNGVLGSAKVLSDPTCIYGGVRLDDGCRKVEGGLKSRVGVPADKRTVLLLGILGLGCILSVKDALCSEHSTAHRVKRNRVVNVLQEGHRRTVKHKHYAVAVNGSGCCSVLLSCKVECESVSVYSVLTGLVESLTCNGEFVATVK